MPQYTPPSIKGIGLKKYLDETAAQHGDNDYESFREALRKDSKLSIAKKFKVNRKTIDRWVIVYLEEKSQS